MADIVNKKFTIGVLIIFLLIFISVFNIKPIQSSNQQSEPFAIIIFPDTQHFSLDPLYYPYNFFSKNANWVVNNKDNLNVKFVLHEGDVVDNYLSIKYWERAKKSMDILYRVVPYAITPGNHDGLDRNRDSTLFNTYFPISDYKDLPTFGGVFEENKSDNIYHYLSAGGVDWLILALEFGPRDQVLDWANEVIINHPDRKVMIVTHTYLYTDNTLHGSKETHKWNPHSYPVADEEGGVNDGVEMWEKLVRRHENIVFVFSGHVLNGVGRLTSIGDNGNEVHQILANYQNSVSDDYAPIRIMDFIPQEHRVSVKTYSPYLDKYKTDEKNQFDLSLSVFDTTPPEASIILEEDKEGVIVTGIDNEDKDVRVAYIIKNETGNKKKNYSEERQYMLEDNNDNTLVLNMKYRNTRRSVSISIEDSKYNSDNEINMENNNLMTVFSKAIRYQRMILGKNISGTSIYNKKKDKTLVIMREDRKIEANTYDGLRQFNLVTDKGALSYTLQ